MHALKKILNEHHLKMGQLAKKSGIDEAVLRMRVKRNSPMSSLTLGNAIALAKALEIPVEKLISYEPE